MYHIYVYILVGGFNPSEKYSSIRMIIPNIWRKNVPKPPTAVPRGSVAAGWPLAAGPGPTIPPPREMA